MRARSARRIRAGVARARSEVLLAAAFGLPAQRVLDTRRGYVDPDPLAQHAYLLALARTVERERPRRYRSTWRPVAA